MKQKTYDSTLARMAGNIAAGLVGTSRYTTCPMEHEHNRMLVVRDAVAMARAIVQEVERTHPPREEPSTS